MMRNVVICACTVVCLCFAGLVIAADNGPEEMTLQAVKDAAKKPKPAVFPHRKHQEFAQCADCHHTAKDGKQVAYSEGMTIQKCEDCHFSGSGMPKKLDSFKNAAHENCRTCHKEKAAENPELKDKFKGCKPCHQ